MPYIIKENRNVIDGLYVFLNNSFYEMLRKFGIGNLNYLITKILLKYLPEKPSYKDYNEIIGVLECIKLEFYRRAVAKYEEEKIKENGDVY